MTNYLHIFLLSFYIVFYLFVEPQRPHRQANGTYQNTNHRPSHIQLPSYWYIILQPSLHALLTIYLLDLFNITNSGIDLLSQFEESLVTRAFTSHVEKFTGSVRAAHESADKWEPSEFIIDFAKLNRNVLVQLLYIGDPERSKSILLSSSSLSSFSVYLIFVAFSLLVSSFP